jgi:hypothetical protein
MRDWTVISSFDGLDLTESFILSWTAENGDALFEVDFALVKGHPNYRQAGQDEWARFRRGTLRFPNVRSIAGLPPMTEVRPAVDATGELDYGHFDSFVEVASGQFEVAGDFGIFRVECDQPTVAVHAIDL